MTFSLPVLVSPTASVQRLSWVGPWGEPGGGAAGPAGEAKLRAGPDEGAHVLALLPRVRGGAGAGDRPQGPHQVGGDEQQVPEGHQRGYNRRTHTDDREKHAHLQGYNGGEDIKDDWQRPKKSFNLHTLSHSVPLYDCMRLSFKYMPIKIDHCFNKGRIESLLSHAGQ